MARGAHRLARLWARLREERRGPLPLGIGRCDQVDGYLQGPATPPMGGSRRAPSVPGSTAALAASVAAIAGTAAAMAPALPGAALPAGASRALAGAAPAVTGGRAALVGHHAVFVRCVLTAESPPRVESRPRPLGGIPARRPAVLALMAQGPTRRPSRKAGDPGVNVSAMGSSESSAVPRHPRDKFEHLEAKGDGIILHTRHLREPG